MPSSETSDCYSIDWYQNFCFHGVRQLLTMQQKNCKKHTYSVSRKATCLRVSPPTMSTAIVKTNTLLTYISRDQEPHQDRAGRTTTSWETVGESETRGNETVILTGLESSTYTYLSKQLFKNIEEGKILKTAKNRGRNLFKPTFYFATAVEVQPACWRQHLQSLPHY